MAGFGEQAVNRVSIDGVDLRAGDGLTARLILNQSRQKRRFKCNIAFNLVRNFLSLIIDLTYGYGSGRQILGYGWGSIFLR